MDNLTPDNTLTKAYSDFERFMPNQNGSSPLMHAPQQGLDHSAAAAAGDKSPDAMAAAAAAEATADMDTDTQEPPATASAGKKRKRPSAAGGATGGSKQASKKGRAAAPPGGKKKPIPGLCGFCGQTMSPMVSYIHPCWAAIIESDTQQCYDASLAVTAGVV
jgi:hypothetical protein